MAFNNFYGGYQPMYPPTGAVPDALGQFKAPYVQPQMQAQAQGTGGLLWVQGEAGAKSYCVAPGQNVLLMDSEALRFYIKSADGSGMPLPLRIFEYKEITAQADIPKTVDEHFVTREEFDALKNEIAKMNNKKEEVVNE